MNKEKDGFWRSLGWPEWLLTGTIVVIIIAVAAILSPDLRRFIASSVTAAWVQALGSLVALFVVYGASRKQAQAAIQAVTHSHDLLQQSRRESVLAIAAAAHQALRDCRNTIEEGRSTNSGFGVGYDVRIKLSLSDFMTHADSLLESMRRTDVSQLEDAVSVGGFLRFQHMFHIVMMRAEKCTRSLWDDPVQRDIFDSVPEGEERRETVQRASNMQIRVLEDALKHAEELYLQLCPQASDSQKARLI